ncbi:MAG: hypothetical protein EA369_08375 [Bradymonadales bacterium]|nr:MAG: hypothetical protein EA369_08375 [Bradymonadales bacterium]
MKYFFILISPAFNRLVWILASGPWGVVHQLFIGIFRRLYGISDPVLPEHRKLSEYFLRDKPLPSNWTASLICPVDCFLLEGPSKVEDSRLSLKGIDYDWKSLPEWCSELEGGFYWNFYLAPKHYHWFHSPASGEHLEVMRVSGRSLPVNRLGRFLSNRLYAENERLSFRWQHPQYGRVLMLCVGAMGVSRIRSAVGECAKDGPWWPLKEQLKVGERLGAFELGSSVILAVEKAEGLRVLGESLELGFPLQEC